MSDPRLQATDLVSPGPWELDWHSVPSAGPHVDFPDLHYVNIRSAGYFEAAPHGLSLTGYVRPADARLMVAAPDMLNALKFVRRLWAEDDSCAEIAAIDRAIAKAEGRS